MTVKLAALVAVPPGVATAIVPVVASAGTVAVIVVWENAVKLAAALSKATAAAPVKALLLFGTRLSPVHR